MVEISEDKYYPRLQHLYDTLTEWQLTKMEEISEDNCLEGPNMLSWLPIASLLDTVVAKWQHSQNLTQLTKSNTA